MNWPKFPNHMLLIRVELISIDAIELVIVLLLLNYFITPIYG